MWELLMPAAVAFLVCLAVGPVLLPLLTKLKFGQTVREDGPKSHLKKTGTPTMGGLVMLVAIILTCVFLLPRSYAPVLAAMLSTMGYGVLGFIDDYIKVAKKRSMGLRAYQKIIGQLIISFGFALYCWFDPEIGSKIFVPFINIYWDLGWLYIPFSMFVAIGMTNSVNLTDGLDGLASGVTMVLAGCYSLLIFFLGMAPGAVVLDLDMRSATLVFSGAVTGACLGFLRFNTYPARVFMGDTGSLALGGAITAMMMLMRLPLLIPIMGFMFMLSSISVILQVGSYKIRKKRIFKMAPLHHHFELSGIAETRVVAMYLIATAALCFAVMLAITA